MASRGLKKELGVLDVYALATGATLSSDMIHRRSNYLASASPKSGGFDPYNPIPENVEPDNKIAVITGHIDGNIRIRNVKRSPMQLEEH